MDSDTDSIEIEDYSTIGAIVQNSKNVDIESINVNTVPLLDGFDLPPLIKTFVGRNKELNKLKSLFFNEDESKIRKKVVICGVPGIGKSELAKRFAKKCLEERKIQKICWIESEREDLFKKSYEQLKYIFESLEGEKCLFILDNAVSRKFLAKYKFPDEFFYLITSQRNDWGDDIKPIKLTPLTPDASVHFYKIYLEQDYKFEFYDLYLKVADFVGCLPLGLQITAAYIRKSKKSYGKKFLETYVEELERTQNEIVEQNFPQFSNNPYKNSLYGAIKVSLSKISIDTDIQSPDLALYALYVCSYLNPDNINSTMLTRVLSQFEELPKVNSNETLLNDALVLLDNFSLIVYPGTIRIHRFTQNILRFHLKEHIPQIQNKCYSACLEVLIKYDDKDDHPDDYFIPGYDDGVTVQDILDEISKIPFYEGDGSLPNDENYIDDLSDRFSNESDYNNENYPPENAESNINSVDYLNDGSISEDSETDDDESKKDEKSDDYKVGNDEAATNSEEGETNKESNQNETSLAKDSNGADQLVNENDFSNACCYLTKHNKEHTEDSLGSLGDEVCKYKNGIDVKYEINLHDNTDLHSDINDWNENVTTDDSEDDYELPIPDIEDSDKGVNYYNTGYVHDSNFYNFLEVLRYADENLKIFLDFYKKYEVILLDDTSKHEEFKYILTSLNDYGCIESIEEICKNLGNLAKKYIVKFNLATNVLYEKKFDFVEMYLKFIDINSQCWENQNTLLHEAAYDWNLEGVEFLIGHNAKINLKNECGNTALFEFFNRRVNQIDAMWFTDVADQDDYIMEKMLHILQYKQNKNCRNNQGNTVLHLAVNWCSAEVIELLITKYELDVNAVNLQGFNPLFKVLTDFTSEPERKRSIEKVLLVHGSSLSCTISERFLLNYDEIKYLNALLHHFNNSIKSNILHNVVFHNKLDELSNLLEHQDVNSTDKDRNTALHLASFEGNLSAIKILIEHNAIVDVKSNYGNTPLFFFFLGARYRQNIKLEEVNTILRLLNFNDAKNTVNRKNESIVHLAVASMHPELIEICLKNYNKYINEQDFQGRTPMHEFILQLPDHELINKMELDKILTITKQLKCYGASIDIEDSFGMQPIEYAQKKSIIYIAIFMLFEYQKTELLKRILDDLKAEETNNAVEYINQLNLLHYSVTSNNLAMLSLLLDYVDVNTKNESQETMLHIAAYKCNVEAIQILLNHKADINARTNLGRTPFIYFLNGAFYCNIPIETTLEIFHLLKLSENKNTKCNDGFSLLHYAAYSLNVDLVDLLVNKYNLQVNDQDNKLGFTPLFLVVKAMSVPQPDFRQQSDIIQTVEILIKGSRLDIRNKRGQTALMFAKSFQQPRMEFLFPYLLNINQ